MDTIIGVSGHRFLAQLERVCAGIDRALDRIEEALPAETTTVISMLAEGADRIVANRVLERPNSRLIALLPLPQDDYLSDFVDEGSRRAFFGLVDRADETLTMPPSPSRDEAYMAAGHWMVDHCQVLLTVWDGELAQGTGGTADIVHHARDRGLPVAWVHAGNRRPGTTVATDLGDRQGTVTFERFPERTNSENQKKGEL